MATDRSACARARSRRWDFDNVIINPNPAYVAFAVDFESAVFNLNVFAGNWSRLQSNGGWILRNTDVTGGARLLILNAGHSSFGTQAIRSCRRTCGQRSSQVRIAGQA